jgi:uncharacterized protein (TIGR02246 family)
MATQASAANTAESEIRALIDDWAKAVEARDYDRIIEHYDDNVRVFDVPPPLEARGRDTYRKHWEDWLGTFTGKVKCETQGLELVAGDEVAFAHCLTKISDVADDGTESGSWVRVTVGYKKDEGTWKVVHEHASVPFQHE